jgi:thiol-disulfide isomerase/thioredoxin
VIGLLFAAAGATAAEDAGGTVATPRVGDEQPRLIAATAPEILRAVRSSASRAVLVNVWATWCIPCRKEFPDLVRLSKRYADRDLEVFFVSGDFADERSQVIEFLAQHGVVGDTYLKVGKDEEFIDAFDPEWSGALPATFLYDEIGSLRHSVLGSAPYEQLDKLIVALLKENEATHIDKEGSPR